MEQGVRCDVYPPEDVANSLRFALGGELGLRMLEVSNLVFINILCQSLIDCFKEHAVKPTCLVR